MQSVSSAISSYGGPRGRVVKDAYFSALKRSSSYRYTIRDRGEASRHPTKIHWF